MDESRRPGRFSIKIRKGLDLPIEGQPQQVVHAGAAVSSVALCTRDFVNLRAKPLVREGQRVALGEPLLCDRKQPEVLFTSPGSGVVGAVVPGPRRAIQSLVVQLEGDAEVKFSHFPRADLSGLPAATVRKQLLDSGLWTSLRVRPFGRIPSPDGEPDAIFIRAMDTNPLAADPAVIAARDVSFFEDGVRIVSRLTSGPIYLCQHPGPQLIQGEVKGLRIAHFQGPHPAGLVGTHIHTLHRVGRGRAVWHLDYQDTIAIGELFRTGRLPNRRIVALGGPMVRRPRLLETCRGCNLRDLLKDELHEGPHRVISGSVLSGRTAFADEGFLGRYDSQVSVIPEALTLASRQAAGAGNGYSVHRLFPASRSRRFSFSTALHGPPSALIPLESLERVMPLDMPVIPLLRALAVNDLDTARALGCLELEEEDLALLTFLCPGKLEYGSLLRSTLTQLEREVEI